MRRALPAMALLASIGGAFGFVAPLATRVGLHTLTAASSQLRSGRVHQTVPALRLSGGAAGMQAAVLDGIGAKDIDGKEVDLGKYSSIPAVLVVNLASAWGLTASNYAELVELTSQISSDKLTVLGFPCNQFGAQEPGSDAEIKAFAMGKGAKFPLFSKIDVNGPAAHPLFQKLKKEAGNKTLLSMFGEDIKWNFGKFLITNGNAIKRYEPTTSPKAILGDINAAIGA